MGEDGSERKRRLIHLRVHEWTDKAFLIALCYTASGDPVFSHETVSSEAFLFGDSMGTEKDKQENLVAKATDSNMKKKLHYRMVPMMLFNEDDTQELNLPMVLSTAREETEIEAGAENDAKTQLKTLPTEEQNKVSTFKNLMNIHRAGWTVYVACRKPTDLQQRFFLNKEQVMDTYNPDELGILMDHYNTVRYTQPHYVIIDTNLPPEVAFQDAIDKIKKMGEQSDFFLNSFTTHSLNRLIKYLVSHHTSCKLGTGGSGTP